MPSGTGINNRIASTASGAIAFQIFSRVWDIGTLLKAWLLFLGTQLRQQPVTINRSALPPGLRLRAMQSASRGAPDPPPRRAALCQQQCRPAPQPAQPCRPPREATLVSSLWAISHSRLSSSARCSSSPPASRCRYSGSAPSMTSRKPASARARAAQPVCGEQPLAGGLPGVVAPQLAIHQPRHIAATSAHSASAPMARPCCCRRPKAVHSNPSENTLPLWVLMPPVARNIWFSQAPSGRSRASCCSAGKVASSRPRWIKRGSHTPMARALR